MPPRNHAGGSTSLEGPHFRLVVQEELLGFDSIAVTSYGPSIEGSRRPEALAVFFPDRPPIHDIAADETAFTLQALHSVRDVAVTIERAEHIKRLHIDAKDSGSRFLEGTTLRSLLQSLCEVLPLGVSTESYRLKAWQVDMGENCGLEGVASLKELEEQGIIKPHELRAMRDWAPKIIAANRANKPTQKERVVDDFNRRFSGGNIFLQMIRKPHDVIVPHVVGEPHLTSQVMAAFKREEGQTRLHTLTPGRSLARHPIPREHVNPRTKRFDDSSFDNSGQTWTRNAMIVKSKPGSKGRQ